MQRDHVVVEDTAIDDSDDHVDEQDQVDTGYRTLLLVIVPLRQLAPV